jgi:DNA-binding NtrC family response regulator
MVRVLVADDDRTLLRALGRVLQTFDVTLVASGQAALEALSQRPFDVVLMDYGIPPSNGIVVLQEIAAAYPTVQRFLMSGFDAETFGKHVASNLVSRFFQKPIDIATLTRELAGAGPAQ